MPFIPTDTNTNGNISFFNQTICQFLLTYNETNTINITAYECLDISRTDLIHAKQVCSEEQLAYLYSNESSFCGTLPQNAVNVTSYPYICYNSSNLCRNPQIFPNITCLHNATTRTLCDKQYQTSSIILPNSNNNPINVLLIQSSPDLLSSKHNVICLPDLLYPRFTECHSLNTILPSGVVPQIAHRQFQTSNLSIYMQFNKNMLSVYHNSKIFVNFGSSNLSTYPKYSSSSLSSARAYPNPLLNETLFSPDSCILYPSLDLCQQFNDITCLFSSDQKAGLCSIKPNISNAIEPIVYSGKTICHKLFSLNETQVYECLESNKLEVFLADTVCSFMQLSFLTSSNSSTICGYNDEYACYASSRLYRLLSTKINTVTCFYNSTDNTLCNQPVTTEFLNIPTTENTPLANMPISTTNTLVSPYNIICMTEYIANLDTIDRQTVTTNKLDCYFLNGILPSGIITQSVNASLAYSGIPNVSCIPTLSRLCYTKDVACCLLNYAIYRSVNLFGHIENLTLSYNQVYTRPIYSNTLLFKVATTGRDF